MPTSEQRGLAFAQQRCASCHAVVKGASPNPEAPPFEAVINAADLKLDTLRPWLQSSHNYPAAMNFSIDPGQIDDLAAYMLTLKNPACRPPIQ
jgi:mono/diheme cytochrome c family protein